MYWIFIFLSSFIENVFPPYPGDTVTVFGGYLAGTGSMSLISLSVSVFFGSLSGAIFMFFMGERVFRFVLRAIKNQRLKETFSGKNLLKTHHWFMRWGFLAITFSRFSAGLRFFVAIVAGMIKMNPWIFALAFSLATVIWNGFLIYGGYSIGDNWPLIMRILKVYNQIIVGILVLLITAGVLYWRHHKKKKSIHHAENTPDSDISRE